MAKLLRDRYLWSIIALIGMAAISAYLVEDYVISRLPFGLATYEAQLILVIPRSGLLLMAVSIAAWRYRFKGGLAAAFAIGLVLLPHIIAEMTAVFKASTLAFYGIGAVTGIAFSWLVGSRKQAEKMLQQSEEKYRTLVDNALVGVYRTNVKGDILYVNDILVKMLGFDSAEEMIASGAVVRYQNPSDRAILLKELTEKGKVDSFEFEVVTKTGEIKKVILNAVLEGDILSGMVIDITERKRGEEELVRVCEEVKVLNLELEARVKERTRQLEQAVQTAEVASRAKSDFLASMSHELRTPLNAVIGFSQVLQEQYFGKLNEKQAEYITDILESGQHLLSLINDVLDLAKIEAGKMELELAGVKIKDLLERSLVMVKEKALAHGINLDIQTTAELEGLEIRADERRIKQVMFNLLSNAAKFTPDGGAITVEGRKEGKELIISVSDTGIGIAPGEQARIFEEFYQVNGSAKDKTPGTGLGLAVSQRIVGMHGGRIWVESKGLGKGSRFTFTLPV